MSRIRVAMDKETDNGIPYNSGLYDRNFEYKTVVTDLDGLVTVRKEIMSGSGSVSHYKIGSREITKGTLTASQVLKYWDDLWRKKELLEGKNGGKARKVFGIIPRDNW